MNTEALRLRAIAERELQQWERMTDDAALAQFEALVQAQQPATEPWQPVTDYSLEARKAIEGPHAQLILQHLIECDDADILDYGCGPDAHLVRMLREASHGTQVSVKGFDPQRPGSEAALRRMGVYDLVICREVLEHLTIRQIRDTVTRLCAMTAIRVYVTTRFAKAPQHLLDVDTSDDLDPTHITMLNQTFLRVLFVLEGFRRRADLEQRMDWKQLGRVLVYERH